VHSTCSEHSTGGPASEASKTGTVSNDPNGPLRPLAWTTPQTQKSPPRNYAGGLSKHGARDRIRTGDPHAGKGDHDEIIVTCLGLLLRNMVRHLQIEGGIERWVQASRRNPCANGRTNGIGESLIVAGLGHRAQDGPALIVPAKGERRKDRFFVWKGLVDPANAHSRALGDSIRRGALVATRQQNLSRGVEDGVPGQPGSGLRRSLGAFEFEGHAIPEGTSLIISPAFIHRMPTIYPDPDTFRPARFSGSDPEDAMHPCAWIPFGKGPHTCMGMHLARLEIRAFFAKVLARFRIEAIENATLRMQHVPVQGPAGKALPIQLLAL